MPNLAPEGELQRVPIGDFTTEAGATIQDAHIAYQRWGQFRGDPKGDNNILVVCLLYTSDAADE